MRPDLFLYVTTLLLGLLSVVWTRKDWGNALIKCLFVALFIWGLLLSAVVAGFVVKT